MRRWTERALAPGDMPGPGEGLFRFVCSFATTQAEIAQLAVALRTAL
jgi:threonine aldolase